MSVFDKIAKLSLKMKVIISVAVVAVIAAVIVCIVMMNQGYLATTMRLLRVEGTVNIEDSNGGSKPVIDNIRFQSGDALNTGDNGLASVGLDDTKIITLQNNSRAEFTKNRKKLELRLTQGALFFEVTEHLKDDETFEIVTSTMTAGIRGTSGYVYYDDDGHSSMFLTDGVVAIDAYNPTTGETKTAEVHAGQKITVYTFDDRSTDSVTFEVDNFTPDELPDCVLLLLADNEALLERICADTGWDKETVQQLIDEVKSGSSEIPESTTADTSASESSMATSAATTVTSASVTESTTETTEETTSVTSSTRITTSSTTEPAEETPEAETTETASTETSETSSTEMSSTEPSSTETTATEVTAPSITEASSTESSATEISEESTWESSETEPTTSETVVELIEGYTEEVWGVEYSDGRMIYICSKADDTGVDYLGYDTEVDDWIVLDTEIVPGTIIFYTNEGDVYYKMEIPTDG